MLLFLFISVACAMKMKESAPEMALYLFQNCDFPEGLSEAFDAQVVLNDDAVGIGLATILDCRPSLFSLE